jgi:hypothetical protein
MTKFDQVYMLIREGWRKEHKWKSTTNDQTNAIQIAGTYDQSHFPSRKLPDNDKWN